MCTSDYIDITFTLSSLSQFTYAPYENHLPIAIKILGYLKKYPKKRYNIDSSPFIANFPSTKVATEFNHQYDYFPEHLDSHFPDLLYRELTSTIFIDTNYGHDIVIGKVITEILSFIGNILVDWEAKS